MPSLQTATNPRFTNLTYIGLITFVASVSYMTINSESPVSAGYLLGMGMALICAYLVPIGAFCGCIFFTIPFTSVLKLPIEAFSFMTLLQILLVTRVVFSNRWANPIVWASIVACATITQLVPFMVFDQVVSNFILLVLNLFTFYCIYILTKANNLNISLVFFAFALGVLIAGIISQSYGITVTEFQEYRFSGLWTDPNFWGMFCLIGITTCLILGFHKPILFILMAPIIIGLAMQGFLTLSRTFVVVCTLMVLVITLSYIRKNMWAGVLVLSVLAIGVIYALPFAIEVFSERGFDNNDISNGRFDNTVMIFNYIMDNPDATFFGFGYFNTLNVMHENDFGHGATHNTYADIFVEFGAVFNLIFLLVMFSNFNMVRKFISHLYTLPGLVVCVLLFYMGTLSMLKYSLLYLIFGLYLGYCNQSLENANKFQ